MCVCVCVLCIDVFNLYIKLYNGVVDVEIVNKYDHVVELGVATALERFYV